MQLSGRSGTEVYVEELAIQLRRVGHTPILYSPTLGPLAEQLARRSIPVVDSLASITHSPDVIHGHHAMETMAALLHFPEAPGVFVCHDFDAWHDTPPRFPRLYRYLPVDATCGERLTLVHGIDAQRIEVVQNSVDLQRFQQRAVIPARPRRGLVFSNYASYASMRPIQNACRKAEIELDAVGAGIKTACDKPEELLPRYDLVFAKGRCAREAIACGCAVIVCDVYGAGGLVTPDRLNDFLSGRRFQQQPSGAEQLYRQIQLYDPEATRETSNRLREAISSEVVFDQLLTVYRDVIEQHHDREVSRVADAAAELRAAAEFIEWWSGQKRRLIKAQARRRRPDQVAIRLFRSASERAARLLRGTVGRQATRAKRAA